MSRVCASHRSSVGGRRMASDWGVALAVVGAVLIYLHRHWLLLDTPIRQLLEGLR